MDGGCRTGSKSKPCRKTKRRSLKKRPASATLLQPPSGGSSYTADRYHSTSFPLVSDLTDTLQQAKDDDGSRMSWCSGDADDVGSHFPFLQLPAVCQLRVFKFLNNLEKGQASRVCKTWSSLLHDPCLWYRVSFSDLPQSCLPRADHPFSAQCYTCYKKRVFQFASYLEDIRPVLRYFEFKFDIFDQNEKYGRMIERLLAKCACRDLRGANLNWKETPSEPLWMDNDGLARSEEVVQKHRFRQRLFVHFFDRFTALAPRLSTLILPFDWSDSSISSISRLRNLRNLVLEKYFVFQHLPQTAIDRLLISLPHLRRMLLEVWTPSSHGLVLYTMSSKSLQDLDISQSRGFYIQALNMPNMKRFRVARHPWNGPLVLAEHVNIVCIHSVLANGAPQLTKINDHYLEPDWRNSPSDRLEEVLRSVCSCRKHKTSWAM